MEIEKTVKEVEASNHETAISQNNNSGNEFQTEDSCVTDIENKLLVIPVQGVLLNEENISAGKRDDLEQKLYSIEEEIARIVGEDIIPESNDTCESENKTNLMESTNVIDGPVKMFGVESKQVDVPMNCNEDSALNLVAELEQLNTCIDLDDVDTSRENSVDHEEIDEYEISDVNAEVKKKKMSSKLSNRSIEDSDNTDFEEDYIPILQEGNSSKILCSDERGLLDNNGDIFKGVANNSDNEFPVNGDSDIDGQYDITKLLDVKEVKDLHRCSVCQYTTTHLSVLRRHVMTVHNSKTTWKCKHCEKEFGAKILVESHVRKEHSKKIRKCPYCAYKLFCYGKIMKKHINQVHGPSKYLINRTKKLRMANLKKPFECSWCFFSSTSAETVRSHTKMHALKYVLRCRNCYYIINDIALYIKHVQENHKMANKVFICRKCYFQTEQAKELELHFNDPHKTHFCSKCDFYSCYIETYYCHLKTHETVVKKDYNELCTKCGYVGTSKEDLKNHQEKDHVSKENNIEFEDLDQERSSTIKENLEEDIFSKNHDLFSTTFQEGHTLYSCLKCPFVDMSRCVLDEHLATRHPKMSSKGKTNSIGGREPDKQNPENGVGKRFMIEAPTSASKRKNGYSFQCKHCDFKTSALKFMVIHYGKKHNILYCPSCVLRTDNKLGLLKHIESWHQNNSELLRCPFCGFDTDDSDRIKHHVNIEHLEILLDGLEEKVQKNADSSNCSEDSSNANQRITDAYIIWEYDSKETYHCSLCLYYTMDISYMKTHLRSAHIITRKLMCPMCSEIFPLDPEKFTQHLNQHCPHCSFRSVNQEKLKLHILSHVPKYNRSSSDITSRKVSNPPSTNKNLKSEMKTESKIDEVKPDPISNGEIQIIIDSELNSFKVAEDIENDSCKPSKTEEILIIFDDSFVDIEDDLQEEDDTVEAFEESPENSRLLNHSKNTRGKNEKDEPKDYEPIRIIKMKEYQCFDCLHVYKNRCSLMDHRKRVHTLKKPHSCTYCTDVFRSYSQLKSHYYRMHQASYHHHKGPIFKCPLCTFTSIQLKEMRKHVEKLHRRKAVGFAKNI